MSPDECIDFMMESNGRFALDVAEAIARMEGWKCQGDPVTALKHIRRILRAEDNRGFKYRWAPVVARFSVFHDVPNLTIVPIDDAVRQAQFELRRDERENPKMLSVRPRRRSDRRTG